MITIKATFRKPGDILAQLLRRQGEKEVFRKVKFIQPDSVKNFAPEKDSAHNEGPLLKGCGRQFKIISRGSVKINTSIIHERLCYLKDGSIVDIENIAYCLESKNYVAIGRINRKYYHVCAPGLPSCLGHDLLEGIIAYDMQLMINYFTEKGWFTTEFLNNRIAQFKYCTIDGQDKSESIDEKYEKCHGGAWQILTLLRLFPVFVGDKIQDFQNEVWLNYVKLTEIVEIILSPQIHVSSIFYLEDLINEYISLRLQKFPNTALRPKHHYLTHYPELIEQFGPLCKVCTLRFESKHTYLKGQ